MKESTKFIVSVVFLIVILSGAVIFYNYASGYVSSDSQEAPHGQDEQRLPDFTVFDSDGNEVRLSDMEGKPVIINFWASWCGFCIEEMPDFEEMYLRYRDDIHFMMINATHTNGETQDVAKRYIADNGYTFPVYYDTNQDAVYKFAISSFPATFFVDSSIISLGAFP